MFELAIVGLDTSHSVALPQLIQGDDRIVDGLEVTKAMRFPSPFQDESGQDERQEKLEKLDIEVTRSFYEAVDEVDGVMLEINDPSLHLEYFTKCADLGVPVFIDKPLADSLENGIAIYELARKKNIKVWSSSSLRFVPEVQECADKVKNPRFSSTFGPLGQAASGSSLIWYGVHTFEMLVTLMGCGADTVFARKDPCGVVAVVQYGEGRRGVVECNSGAYKYGGMAQLNDSVETFVTAGSPYPHLVHALRSFFLDGVIPVPLEEALEVQALMEAADKSVSSGKSESIDQL